MNKIIQLYSDKNKTIKAYPKTLASQVYMDDGTTTINSQLDNIVQQKVDKVDGMGLTKNNYDDNEKNEVSKIKNKADKNELSVLDTKINSTVSGSPKNVFATLSLLQADATANTPEGKKSIYVVNADDSWYFWNGSAWTSGGIYQAKGILDGSVTPQKTSFCITQNNPDYTPVNLLQGISYEIGKIRGVNGQSTVYATYDCSPLIPVIEGCEYSLNVKYVNMQYYLYDKDGINGTVTQLGAMDSQTEVKITIPTGKKFIAFNCMNTSSYNKPQSLLRNTQLENEKNIIIPNLKVDIDIPSADKPIKLNRNGNSIVVEYKLKDNKNIRVELKNKGTNNLFDFSKIDIVENGVVTNYSTINTDIHSPFAFKVVNNADGDKQTSSFTGGNHGYDGNISGGATARPISLEMYADGITVPERVSYCNKLTLKWKSRVQAWNTKKADGTGREALEETHIITFDGDKWNSETELLFLEDCQMSVCYGFQYFFDRTRTQIEYIGGNNRATYEATVSSNCGTNIVNGIKVIDKQGLLTTILETDVKYDLGDRRFFQNNNTLRGAFTEPTNKCYFQIADTLNATANCKYRYRGSYQFIG